MRRILWDDRGYALVLTLLFMPVFVGLSLVIIDLGRANNAHSDLYAAADAVALAAAGELDGGPNAISRAKGAMTQIDNSVSFLSLVDGEESIDLKYVDVEGNEFTVIFLREIPLNDSDPIDQAWVDANATNVDEDARYAYVRARSNDLDTIFPTALGLAGDDVPVLAVAVAGRREVACGITPLWICNPFEDASDPTSQDIAAKFDQGLLHGRIIKLHAGGNNTAGPGNFAFLAIGDGPSNPELKAFFEGDGAPVCIDTDGSVDTKPGGNQNLERAVNTRFDIWHPSYKDLDKEEIVPAINVRKGHITDGCTTTFDDSIDLDLPVDQRYKAGDPQYIDVEGATQLLKTYENSTYTGFPDNYTMNDFGDPALGVALGDGGWNILEYFVRNHGVSEPDTPPANPEAAWDYLVDQVSDIDKISRFPGQPPSRYDVFLYENDNTDSPNMITGTGATAEDGNPQCNTTATRDPERRLVQGAVVNCLGENISLNGAVTLPVQAVASFFMVRPWEAESGGTIDVEVVDITGTEGLGTLENYIRVESVLVR